MNELERAMLVGDLPEHGLADGDLGTIVMVHPKREGYEVEFVTLGGDTVAVVTLGAGHGGPEEDGVARAEKE